MTEAVWTGDNLDEAFALFAAAPRTHALSWRREGDGLTLYVRERAGGWPKDPITPADYRRVPIGARLSVSDGRLQVTP